MTCLPPELISRYVDGELSPEEARGVKAHLRHCAVCLGIYEELQETGESLKSCFAAAVAPDLKPSPHCLDEETLLAYADGSLDERERESVARHLAGCGYCSLIAARSLKTARLTSAASREMEALPAHLVGKVRERLFFPKPVPIGTIEIGLGELWRMFQERLSYPREAFGFPFAVREPRKDFIAEVKPADALEPSISLRARSSLPPPDRAPKARKRHPRPPRGRRWEFRRPGCRLEAEMWATPAGKADLRLRLLDDRGSPIAGEKVALRIAAKVIKTRVTGKRGGASFRSLSPAQYHLVFHLPKPLSLALILT